MHNFFLHKNILIFRRFFNSANRLALEIRSTPVLTGEDAERFVREAEENERNPQRRRLAFSFEDIFKSATYRV